MFVRHLLSTTILAAGPAWQNSDIGQYATRIQYDLDRAAGIIYRTTAAQRGDNVGYGGFGQVDSQGRLLQGIGLTSASPKVSLFATNAIGPTGPALATYPVPRLVVASPYQAASYWQLYGLGANLYRMRQSGVTSLYDLTHIDLASGQSFPMGTLTTAEVPAPIGFNTGDELYVLSGRFFGYQQTTSSDWFTTIPAGSGRASRASIPRQIYEEKGRAPLWQMRAASTPRLVDITPWRRPKLATTRVRAFALTIPSVTYPNGPGTIYATPFPRRNIAVEPMTISTTEIELSDSLGTETLNGQPVTRHTLAIHTSLLSGFLKVSNGGGLEFVATSRGDGDDTLTLQQYLNADGSPSGEFVNAAVGRWFYAPSTTTTTGTRPLFSTVNNLLSIPIGGNGSGFNVLDLSGQFVRTGTFPPGYNANAGGLLYLPNADMLWMPTNLYATGYASFDLGTTWVQLKHWGPRGSKDPGSRPASLPAENQELRTAPALFYT